jgi:hypothetical protein
MNTQQISKPLVAGDRAMPAWPGSLEGFAGIGIRIGTFAGSNDFIVRIRNGKPIAADTGDQGGGQN